MGTLYYLLNFSINPKMFSKYYIFIIKQNFFLKSKHSYIGFQASEYIWYLPGKTQRSFISKIYWLFSLLVLFIPVKSCLSLSFPRSTCLHLHHPAETPLILLLFSHWVVSDSLWPHGLQHTRLPGSSPSPRACSNSCPLSQWCHPTISSSVTPFSSCLQSSYLGHF